MPPPNKAVDPMQKAIPRNPKYDDIGPIVDTGASLSRYLKKIEEFRENYKMKDDEIFKRIKLSTFVQLILQIYETREQTERIQSFENLSNSTQTNMHHSYEPKSDPQVDGDNCDKPPSTARSTLESLVHGVGEFENYSAQQQKDETVPTNVMDLEQPYLLLDLRDRDEFDSCHIITALNYPIAMLSRSVNYETAEMLAFRNKPGCIIILYDEDERIGPRAATTLVQRGYSNVMLLSGGLKLAWKHFPEGLIIGEMPSSIRMALKNRPRERVPSSVVQQSRIGSAASTMTALTNSSHTGRGTITSKTPTIYCQPGSRDSANGMEEFLSEDILKLNLSLEKAYDDGRSIRSNYAHSIATSVRQTSTSPSIHKKPFR